MAAQKILLMGASYGSLLASKILFGGHSVHLVCLPAEADLINAEGFRVFMPIRGREGRVTIDSRKLPGKVTARSIRDGERMARESEVQKKWRSEARQPSLRFGRSSAPV